MTYALCLAAPPDEVLASTSLLLYAVVLSHA